MFVKDLNLELKQDIKEIQLDDKITLSIKQYLPQDEKSNLISEVVQYALDPTTMLFSPVKLETYFLIMVAKYYAEIEFSEEEFENIANTYDILETNGIFDLIKSNIPATEYEYLESSCMSVVASVEKYNLSIGGLLSAMTTQTGNLSESVTEILKTVQGKEGFEDLSKILKLVDKTV